MSSAAKYLLAVSFAVFSACTSYHRLLNDEVVLNDESSQTGTILKVDSASIKLMRPDESISVIRWQDVDTVQGKKHKSYWAGINFGYYNTPYFSVFRNEAMTGKALGIQGKAGIGLRNRRLFYAHISATWATPYSITKFGAGTQHYSKKSSYLSDFAFFWGGEFNFMNAKMNNGAQNTLEPFLGIEQRLSDQLRLHIKFALQINLANKNNNAGFNLTLGLHAFKRNFKKYYSIMNKERRLPEVRRFGFSVE